MRLPEASWRKSKIIGSKYEVQLSRGDFCCIVAIRGLDGNNFVLRTTYHSVYFAPNRRVNGMKEILRFTAHG